MLKINVVKNREKLIKDTVGYVPHADRSKAMALLKNLDFRRQMHRDPSAIQSWANIDKADVQLAKRYYHTCQSLRIK
jgi:hypothetical protein